MNILITGSNGYIGQKLVNSFISEHNIVKLTRQECDLANVNSVNEWFKNKKFDVVIHTAACGGNRLKKETSDILDENLIMFFNLLKHKSHFSKFINFGSGAEIYKTNSPYGLSKAVIAESMKDKPNFFNIRIYAAFDEEEDDRRFIKSNILRYKNKEPLVIHQDKKMDFFYMKDLISLVKYYINNDNPPKEIDCTYKQTLTLSQIASIINSLDNHKCEIVINSNNLDQQYCGTYTPLIDYFGIETGIKEVYKVI
jgi:nucleoside-diphosphate-sugar epimerase